MRMVLFITLLCFSSLSAAQTRLQKLEVRFHGNDELSSSTLSTALKSNGVQTYRADVSGRIITALSAAYTDAGFLFMRVDSISFQPKEDSATVEADMYLTEGGRVYVGALMYEGNTSIGVLRLQRESECLPGTVFSDAALQRDIGRLLAIYDRGGFPFASIAVKSIDLRYSTDSLLSDITLQVVEGDTFRISEISVEGNALTETDVIVRETRIGKDELYNVDKVAEIRPRLERLNFFSSVSEPELYMRNSSGGLTIRVVEGSTNVFDGIIGYQPPRTPGESGYLTGLVNLSFRNLFGTGRRFDARWERATQSVSELELRYLEPWLFSYPVNVQGGFFQRQQDSAYVRRSLDGKVTYLASSSLSFSASVQSAAVIPSENALITTLPASSTLAGGLELVIDTRDNVYNPRSGIMLRNGYSGGNKSFTSAFASERQRDFLQRIEVDFSYFVEIFPRNGAAVSVHGRELRGNAADESDMYRLGGANSLRGYREEQFTGMRVGWMNLEYRYSLGWRSFAFAFFDLGYIFQPANIDQQREEFSTLKRGFGVGGRIETGLGILGVSYALGEGDSFTNGKIHFGLINEF